MKKQAGVLFILFLCCIHFAGCSHQSITEKKRIFEGVWGLDQLLYGTETVLEGSDGYRQFTGEGLRSPLVVFPDKDVPSVSEDFYYEYRDEIFAPVCQVYLKRTYSPEAFSKEKERLSSKQLSYTSQTNQLYFDEEHFVNDAYVALADWIDRYEYALIIDNLNTIVYVYLHNMTRAELYMDEAYLPVYFQDNNVSALTDETMTPEHRSFYAFKIGNQYIECMDLVK